MKLDFDEKNVRKVKIELLACEVEVMLKSLEYYAYTYKFMFPRFGKSTSKEENLRISLVCDTYEHIMNEFGEFHLKNSIDARVLGDDDDFLKKIA